jgi:hypothetical protein
MNPDKFEYWCGDWKTYTPDLPVEHEHGKYLVVVCDKCCNVPVMHLLKKKGVQ